MIFVDGDFQFVELAPEGGAVGSPGNAVPESKSSRLDRMSAGSTDEERVKGTLKLQLCSEEEATAGSTGPSAGTAEVEEITDEVRGAEGAGSGATLDEGVVEQVQSPHKKQKGDGSAGLLCSEVGAGALKLVQGAVSAMAGLVAPEESAEPLAYCFGGAEGQASSEM